MSADLPSAPAPAAPPQASPRAAGDGLRERLRAATDPCHRRLEARLDLLAPMPDAEAGRRRFAEILGAFLGFHAAWEPALAEALPAEDAWLRSRRRGPLIAQDLVALGVSEEAIAALPACPDAASLCADAAHAWGTLYVLEGSTLGGRVIARHLAGAPWCPPGGLRYFDPYGADAGRRWKDTVERLERLPPADWDDAVDGAVATFARLIEWLPAAAPGAPAAALPPSAQPA